MFKRLFFREIQHETSFDSYTSIHDILYVHTQSVVPPHRPAIQISCFTHLWVGGTWSVLIVCLK